ncbi:MAG TPA: aminopeptidase P family protein [Cyclobacteriaceae bacterium]|nr:aminopeptidase P family protein [Cyclobacteriaceae bacterium]HMV10920.1 aminopeptidase P family protein [Cyclobacteriaceae bacterium]HMV89780.1 aminopeptidase P family protein [Cyclobacteriaceae bacterium]HMX02393.1 aminopeptidase P family protein [Cyclobacteriaceae bacterium]HMX52136.1 aminopeptidase P family protein [Cyclobacteriaceae bacterium]
MRYKQINKSLFVNNRKRLASELKPGSVAVFNSNDIMPTNADGTMRFRQNSDLFYLTGVDQEETILLLFPDHPEKKFREVLFLRETSELIATWEGHKLTKDEARALSGIETILWTTDFHRVLNTALTMGGAEFIYLNTNEHYRAEVAVETRDSRFIQWCREKYPLHKYERVAPIMSKLRAVKSKEELDQMQAACDITNKAFRRVLRFVKPGVKEYEIEAEFIHEFLRNGSRGFAYEPIIASGANSCVLHYVENNKACKAGDVLLLDVGAEYGNYNADMTRTIPVNGKFTKRQKDVYDAVLRIKRAAMKLLKPGVLYYDYHKEVQKITEAELIRLKLIDKADIKNQNPAKPLFMKYFMHGTGHHLGLDVHDTGNMYSKMQLGMVWTVEPGIYIKEEGLGVRLENNVVIEKNGVRDLMKNIPIEAEEIEDLMNSK